MEEAIKYSVVGATENAQIDYDSYEKSNGWWAGSPEQTINYVSCHDNLTLWDKLATSNSDDSEEDRIKMNKLASAIVFTSQGIPFIQAGEEMLRSKELEDGTYLLDTDVDIAIQVNLDGVAMIGKGHLTHDLNGFHLTGADGKLDYKQSPVYSHTLYSDYYWYEVGDVICIGDSNALYYCFPKDCGDIVAKTRLATEELYKISKKR